MERKIKLMINKQLTMNGVEKKVDGEAKCCRQNRYDQTSLIETRIANAVSCHS